MSSDVFVSSHGGYCVVIPTIDYAGTQWTVKHLFELKNARRVLLEGNVLEYNWAQAHIGFAVLLTVRDEDGQMPWAVVEDITIINNVIRHTSSGINIPGRDGGRRGGQTRRILIGNNLFEDIGGERGGDDFSRCWKAPRTS